MHKAPLVSIVIPMYNSESTIVTCVSSVLRQTYSKYELIIVNDGSTDNSVSIISAFLKSSSIKYKILNQVNQGVSVARNVGMKAATGELIALLDSDDEWLENKLKIQTEIFNNNSEIDFLGTNRNGEHFDRFFLKDFSYLTEISSRLLLYKVFFVTPTVIFKKKILDSVGFFDEDQRYAEEGNFWIRVCNSNRCFLLNESLVITGGGKPHFGFSGLSSNLAEMEKGELKNLKLGYNLKIINIFEYFFLIIYSIAKYFRRIVIVKTRR